jgi:hypothetical protein
VRAVRQDINVSLKKGKVFPQKALQVAGCITRGIKVVQGNLCSANLLFYGLTADQADLLMKVNSPSTSRVINPIMTGKFDR